MPPLLPTILSAAITSLVVAAILFLLERKAPRAFAAFRPGAIAGTLAIGAAFLIAVRLALGGWPEFPATKGDDWLFWIACGAVLPAIVVQLRFFHSIVGPAVLGMLAGGALTEWALRNVFNNSLSPEGRRNWVVGISLFMALACAAGALVTVPTIVPQGSPRRSLITRFRDDHWGTFALGLIFAFGTAGVIFSSSIKLGQSMLGLGMAWAGVALVSLFGGLALTGAAALALALYGCIWCVTYFLASSSPAALMFAAAAPLALLIGYMPALRTRPWLRLIVVAVVAGGLAAGSAGVLAPTYFAPESEAAE